jgi:hypothetical protein
VLDAVVPVASFFEAIFYFSNGINNGKP